MIRRQRPRAPGATMPNWFRKRKLPEPLDPWTLATTEEEGLRVVLRFRSLVPPGIRTEDYPSLLNIYWRYDGSATEGMPAAETVERMGRLESLLEAHEGPGVGFLMLCVTGNSRREWVWYVADERRFRQWVQQALAGEPPFPVEIESAEDPSWSSYTRLLDAPGIRRH
jgi:hypothetical protein